MACTFVAVLTRISQRITCANHLNCTRGRSMLGERPSFNSDQEHQRLVTALRESEILRELAEVLASSLDLNNILKVLTKRTAEVCAVDRCSVWLVEDNRDVFRPAAYY